MKKVLYIFISVFCIFVMSGCNESEGIRYDDVDINPYREFVNASFYEITLSDLYLYRVIEIDTDNNYFINQNPSNVEYYNVITVEILKSYNDLLFDNFDNQKAFLENGVFSENEQKQYLINNGKKIKISIPNDCVELFTKHTLFIGKIKPFYKKVYYNNYQTIDYIINSDCASLLFEHNIFPVKDECIDFSLLSGKQLEKNNQLFYDKQSQKKYIKEENNKYFYNLVIENYFYNLMFLNRYCTEGDKVLADGMNLDGFIEWLNYIKYNQNLEWGENRYSSYPSFDDDYEKLDSLLLFYER